MSDIVETSTYGAELEKAFADTATGDTHLVHDAYFEALAARKTSRGEQSEVKRLNGVAVGVSMDRGEEGLDNGFNLGESATGPVTEAEGGLTALNDRLDVALRDVGEALAAEGAGILNMSNHPLTEITPEFYRNTVVPKPVYTYLNEVRTWDHSAGIDAKAQNSPSTGVAADRAVTALNVILGAGAAFVALYANSPFAAGKVSAYKESRLTLWDRMFGTARSKGQLRLAHLPEEPFRDLREYFHWMFAEDTSMFFVIESSDAHDLKKTSRMIMIEGDPSLLTFLRKPEWQGTVFGSGEHTAVEPSMAHFALHQFTQFAGARVRFSLRPEAPVAEFLSAMEPSGKPIESYFEEYAHDVYIEGRDAGANFPDEALLTLPRTDIARSVVISPSALQAGLIRNCAAADAVLRAYGWDTLRGLKDAAVRSGLDAEYGGRKARSLCEALLAVARDGLQEAERWMLAYPLHVLSSGMNGADRALALMDAAGGASEKEQIRNVVLRRLAAFQKP